jgi:hypothetical protein
MLKTLLPLTSAALAGLAGAQTTEAPSTIAQRLGLNGYEEVELTLAGYPGAHASARLVHGGVEHWIELSPSSVRDVDFQLIEQRDGDTYVQVPTQAPLTYRGIAPTLGAAQVAASWLEDGLYARLLLEDGSSLWIEPLAGRADGAGFDEYVLYRDGDVADHGRTCGTGEAQRVTAGQTPLVAPTATGQVTVGGTVKVAELGVDCDFEYFQDYGSTAATQAQVESVINTMNLQYENEVGITHEITTIIVRTTSNDPYSSTNANTLLNQFVNHWNSSQGSVQRDVAHLFTGKSIQGGVIGIAYLSVICNSSFGYGLVWSDCCGSFASKTDLSAHELGHNWSADHCSCSNPAYTMNPFLTAANRFSPTQTIPQVINYSNGLGCLTTGGGGGGGGNCDNVAYGTNFGGANIGTLSSTTDGQLGGTWTGSYSGFDPNAVGRFIAAGNQATISFGDGTILVNYTNPTVDLNITTNGSGGGAVNVNVPNNPALAGLTAYTQVGFLDASFASGYAFSNGLAVTFCN